MLDDGHDFSFSGLKTAVVQYVPQAPRRRGRRRRRVVPGRGRRRAASTKLLRGRRRDRASARVVIGGGVAANSRCAPACSTARGERRAAGRPARARRCAPTTRRWSRRRRLVAPRAPTARPRSTTASFPACGCVARDRAPVRVAARGPGRAGTVSTRRGRVLTRRPLDHRPSPRRPSMPLAGGAPMNLQPLEDRIVVRPAEAEETTVSGLVIPDTAKEKPQQGEVLAVGPGRRAENTRRADPARPRGRRHRRLLEVRRHRDHRRRRGRADPHARDVLAKVLAGQGQGQEVANRAIGGASTVREFAHEAASTSGAASSRRTTLRAALDAAAGPRAWNRCRTPRMAAVPPGKGADVGLLKSRKDAGKEFAQYVDAVEHPPDLDDYVEEEDLGDQDALPSAVTVCGDRGAARGPPRAAGARFPSRGPGARRPGSPRCRRAAGASARCWSSSRS